MGLIWNCGKYFLIAMLCCGLAFVQPSFAQEIDWMTEAQVLEELRLKSDHELAEMNDEIVLQTTAHLDQANIRADIVTGVVAVVSGVTVLYLGLRFKNRLDVLARRRGQGLAMAMAGLVITAFGIYYAGGAEGRALAAQHMSQQHLRDVVGQDVARNLEALRKWMGQVEVALQQKNFLFAVPDVEQVGGGFDFLAELSRLSLDFYHGSGHSIQVELNATDVITENGTEDDGDEEEDARNYIRVAADNTSEASLREVRRLLYIRVLEMVSQQDVVLTSALHRLSPDRFPSFLDDVAKKRVSLGIVTEHFVFKNPAYQRWQRMPTYEFSVADVLEAGTPELRLSLEYVFSDGKGGMRFW